MFPKHQSGPESTLAADFEFGRLRQLRGRIQEFGRIFKQAFCAAALIFNAKTLLQGSNFCIHMADLDEANFFN